MTIGIIIILAILLFTGFVILQETRSQLRWRELVAEGDVTAIRELLESEVEHWHTSRVPRGTSALLWHGVQTVDLIGVTSDAARLSCSAEGEYALQQGRRIETSSPLAEGMKISMKLAEMAMYDVPNVKLDRIQIDVYTSFRDETGLSETQCILSTLVERKIVEHIDWEEMEPSDFITLTEGRFEPTFDGRTRPVEPLPWSEEDATRSS